MWIGRKEFDELSDRVNLLDKTIRAGTEIVADVIPASTFSTAAPVLVKTSLNHTICLLLNYFGLEIRGTHASNLRVIKKASPVVKAKRGKPE